MTEVRFSGLSSLSFLDGRGTCSKELYTEPQFSFGGFCRIMRQFDFQQHSQKNQRAFWRARLRTVGSCEVQRSGCSSAVSGASPRAGPSRCCLCLTSWPPRGGGRRWTLSSGTRCASSVASRAPAEAHGLAAGSTSSFLTLAAQRITSADHTLQSWGRWSNGFM
jgi:hypothetical protein